MLILNTSSDPRVVDVLKVGKVGVLPTDTIYGLVCHAGDITAVDRLYTLKERHHKPGTVIAASTQQLVDLGLKARYLKAVEHFWPGPISVVIPCSEELDYLDLGKRSLAVRVVADAELRSLLEKTGPLLTSSANHPSEPSATTLKQAQDYFGDSVDFYVEGGDFSNHQPSTIIRIVDDAIEILREGAVNINEKGEIKP